MVHADGEEVNVLSRNNKREIVLSVCTSFEGAPGIDLEPPEFCTSHIQRMRQSNVMKCIGRPLISPSGGQQWEV